MRRFLAVLTVAFACAWLVHAQQPAPPVGARPAPAATVAPKNHVPFQLSIDSIMSGPKLVGTSPAFVRWAPDSSKVYFSWQKPGEDRASTYSVNPDGTGLRQLGADEERRLPPTPTGRPDRARRRLLASEGGTVVVYDVATGARRVLLKTVAAESNARWARHDTAVTFMRDGNLFLMSLDGAAAGPAEVQLTDVAPAGASSATSGGARAGTAQAVEGGPRGGGPGTRGGDRAPSASQQVLREEELALIEHLRREAEQRRQGGTGQEARGGGRAGMPAGPSAEPVARFVPSARQAVTDMLLSSDEAYVFIGVVERPEVPARNQDVPNYVTESAYPEMINGRTDVGDSQSHRRLAILDLKQNKTVWADPSAFAGRERPVKPEDPPVDRLVDWSMPDCSDDGSHCVVTVHSLDNHDRWFVTVDPATGKATPLDTLHDDAWIRAGAVATGFGGAGVGGFGGFGGLGGFGGSLAWLADNKRFLFLAERDGWMHLYSLDVTLPRPQPRPLTSGPWEISSARLSGDRTRVFFTANEVHPSERHFYTVSVEGGPFTRITTMPGGDEAIPSPDEKTVALLHSTISRPPELYVMPFTAGATPIRVTTTPTAEWLAFKWIEPRVISYRARDGAMVYARLYTPEMIGATRDPHRPAVIFVHGAGYLQFAQRYWSQTYYREHMFNHLLASRGYVVLAPDYRASAGYGRDWRTGIYEHMGGKDLDDVVDGAAFLVAAEKVNPRRIGIYGGSYGGFLTLMALFTAPDVFAAGAALRPVTDWAHYNHSYTAPILGLPQTNSAAYRRSSPIYFAEGLKKPLLICHGMVDTNVFYQDTVRLIQRLIELRKTSWSVAPYPVEDHSFGEETSWADEYRRIFALFEENLRK
jgi:dipeptidyl aminopeptidase/acylaminoacyl peptidase